MTTLSSDNQKEMFVDRLNRIDTAHKSGEIIVLVGCEQVRGIAPHIKNKPPEGPKINGTFLANMTYPASIAGAFVIGIFSVFLSRLVRFQIFGVDDPNMDPDYQMLLDAVFALMVGFILKNFFRMEGKEFIAAKAKGIFVAIIALHNLVWMFPIAFTYMFSPEWVDTVISLTEPRSIYFRGVIFTF